MRQVLAFLIEIALFGVSYASQTVATNEHVVTVVNVNGASQDRAELVARIARIESSCAVLRTNVDSWMREAESRAERDAANENKIESRLNKACTVAEEFYEKRYATLNESHDKFMVFISICLSVFTLFGVVLPIVVSLLQHGAFEREIAQVKNGVEQSLAAKIEGAVDGLQKNGLEAMEMTVSHAIQQFDIELPKLDLKDGVAQLDFRLIPIVHGLHLVFDSAMRTKRVSEVRRVIRKYDPFVKRWTESGDERRRQAWHRVEEGMKKAVLNCGVVVVERDYENLLGRDSSEYDWLKRFYSVMAPWKFVTQI